MFRVAHPPSVPRTLHCLSTLWLSCSPPVPENSPPPFERGVWFGRCGVASSLFPQSRTTRGKVATSRTISLQPVPCKFFTFFVLFVSHSKKISLHHRRLTRLQHDTFTEPDTFPYNFTSYSRFILLLALAVIQLFSLHLLIMRSCARIDEVGLITCLFNQPRLAFACLHPLCIILSTI